MISNSLITVAELIGRFHPLLVHLPIGILLIASLFYLLSGKEKYHLLQQAIPITLFCGMICAVLSCISGLLLSTTDEYDTQLVSRHQWLGIATALVSMIAWYFSRTKRRYVKWTMLLMVLLIVLTGHFGGSLTHGSDYLTRAFSGTEPIVKRKPIPDVQNAVVYNDIVQPILQARCYGCHGPNKQKGRLRLDKEEFIMKGGKDGKIIEPGKPDESEMIERLLLPKDDEDHMPPKEKPQPGRQDIDLLQWWVSNGADFTKKVNAFKQPEKIKPVLLALQSGEQTEEIYDNELPEKPVEKADETIVQQLKDRGVAVSPVSANSNYLMVNFIAVDSVRPGDLKLLQSIKKQLLSVKMGNKPLANGMLAGIGSLQSLTRLYLDRTGITDDDLKFLMNLSQLQYLNLVGNQVTFKGIEQLKDLKKLEHIFIYQTEIREADIVRIKKIFPTANVDPGGYTVPLLQGDTAELKAPIKK